MKTEETKQKELEQEEIDKAWQRLWQFANSRISYFDGVIDFDKFVEQGKDIFDLKLKSE